MMKQILPHKYPVIVSAKRTAIGSFLGVLHQLPATELGAHAIRAVIENSKVQHIDEVIMGCVLPAGLGQAPARQASLGAGVDQSVGAITINKVCGSGLKAVMLASDMIRAGSAKAVIAGGMESMSNAPFLLPQGRKGQKMGHQRTLDHMMLDGLENAYDGKAMGCFAQDKADSLHYSREQMDAYALSSLAKAQQAIDTDAFADEIVPIEIVTRRETLMVSVDENPSQARPDKIPHLRPAFAKGGTITAANASSISDGAAALLVMDAQTAQAENILPLAHIVGYTTHAMAPEDFTIAPIGAVQDLLQQLQWSVDEVDLWEINEAFAMVTMATVDRLQIPLDKVNVNGGACALGHPIGASGARILVTLIYALQQRGLKRGIATLCIGGGEAVALAVEMI
ncbi:MAG: thiolase family protein [Glaciecola sp.]|jgi:acetyl-CoA C-acetyltransferase